MKNHIAILHKESDSDYGVLFPDFPGCVTAGSTLDEAKDMAREALLFHIEGMKKDGEAIPEPMSLEQALHVDCAHGALAFFIVEIPLDEQIVRANITLPKGQLERIDVYARTHNLSRSAFLLQAAQKVMVS